VFMAREGGTFDRDITFRYMFRRLLCQIFIKSQFILLVVVVVIIVVCLIRFAPVGDC